MNHHFIYKTEMDEGEIVIEYSEAGVTFVTLPYDTRKELNKEEYKENAAIKAFFDDYFEGKSPDPNKIKLDIKVTEFQRKVYDILLNTKTGTVLTYGDVAKLIGCGAPRAVGQALRKNPVPIIVPCHRIVGSGWEGGFAGSTTGEKMDYKRYLLLLEKNNRKIKKI